MTLTADETTNSTASAFDVELTFYAGPTYADLTLSDYVVGAMPTLTGWVDVSALVIFGGSLSYGRSDSFANLESQHQRDGLSKGVVRAGARDPVPATSDCGRCRN